MICHCWKDYQEWLEESGQSPTDEDNKTCMAMAGHEGNHEWVSDADIIVEVF